MVMNMTLEPFSRLTLVKYEQIKLKIIKIIHPLHLQYAIHCNMHNIELNFEFIISVTVHVNGSTV